MTEFDVKLNNRTSDATVGTSTPTAETKPAEQNKPNIFAGMTKFQAEELGVLDLFTKANVDGGDDISESEYNTFITNNPTVEEGEEVAQSEKVAPHEHDEHTEDTKHAHEHNCSHDHSNDKDAIIFAGMTRAQAEEAAKNNPEVMEVFNQYAENDVITNKNFRKYKKIIHLQHRINKEEYSQMSSSEKIEAINEQLNCRNDAELAIEAFDDKTLTEAVQMLNETLPEEERIKVEDWNAATPEERGKMIANVYLKVVNKALQNDSEMYASQYERLKNGEFTEFEKKELGLQEGTVLTEEQLEKYTKDAIMRSFQATTTNLLQTTGDAQQDENMLALLHGFRNGMIEDQEYVTLLNALGMHKIADKVMQKQAAKLIASQEMKSTDETANYMLADAVVQYGDKAIIETFYENNKTNLANSELIAQAVVNVMNTLPPNDSKRTELQAVLETIPRTTNSEGNNSSNNRGANISGSPLTNEYSTISNPIQRSSFPTIAEMKELSHQMHNSHSETNGEELNPREFSDPSVMEMEKLRRKFRLKVAELKNMPVGEAWGEMVSHLNHGHPRAQEILLRIIKQAAPQKQISAFIDGSPELQKFMRQNQIINNTILYSYLSTHPAELTNAPISIQEMYQEIQAEINKPYERQTI